MNSQKMAGIAWPSLFVIVTGTYAYWAAQRELVSSRPSIPGQYDVPDPVPTPGVETLHSRMWEDPLSIAYNDWKRRREYEFTHGTSKVEYRLKTIPDLDLPVPGNLPEKKFLEKVNREDGRAPVRHLEKQQFFKALVEGSKTVCLPIFVPGSPYAEDKEKRMRIRYAAVTALAEAGYSLAYNQRMSYIESKIFVRTLRGWTEREIVMPVKLYRAAGRPQVVVFWINEAEMGLRPLLTLHRIFNDLFQDVEKEKESNLHISIIGPASSGTLSEMEEDVRDLAEFDRKESNRKDWYRSEHWRFRSYAGADCCMSGCCPLFDLGNLGKTELPADLLPITIYSPRATVSNIEFKPQRFFELRRVIGPDKALAKALASELKQRGALPGNVVLVTEHDTAYGRAIQEEFEEEFEKFGTELCTFKVLRGIDGILPGDAQEDKSSKLDKEKNNGMEIVERLPQGRSQYDYLTRLPAQIHNSLPNGPSAVGVVGSDVYDKLLVLRALRPQFPNSIFFTTDLDSIYTHADERQHTRNLVVASHFGLQLGPKMQKETAPFRDSYQTATFLATRLALDEARARHQKIGVMAELGKESWQEYVNNSLADRKVPSDESLAVREFDTSWKKEWKSKISEAAARIRRSMATDKDFALSGKLKNLTDEKGKANSAKDVLETLVGFQTIASDLSLPCVDALEEVIAHVKQGPPAIAESWKLNMETLAEFNKTEATDTEQADTVSGFQPLIHVIGGDRIQQLSAFEPSTLEGVLHPAPKAQTQGWHIAFVVAVSLLAVVGTLLLMLRDRFRVSLLLGWGSEDFDAEWLNRNDVRFPLRRLRIALAGLAGIGVVLVVMLMLQAFWGGSYVYPLDGFSSWTRNMMYSIAGLGTALIVAYLVDRFIVTLNQTRQQPGGRVFDTAWDVFSMTQAVKVAVVAIALWQTGVLFVCGFMSPIAFTSTLLGFSALALAASYYQGKSAEYPERKQKPAICDNAVLCVSPLTVIWSAMSAMAIVTVLAAILGVFEISSTWYPESRSHGWFARTIDETTCSYAFGMVALALSATIWCHLWCLELSQAIKVQNAEGFDCDDSEYDRLWLVSQLTSVINSLTPAAIAMVLVLVLAYHPIVSPTPMPMGLLVMISIALGIFLAPGLFARWHFGEERKDLLKELQDRPIESEVDPDARNLQPELVSPGGEALQLKGDRSSAEREVDVQQEAILAREARTTANYRRIRRIRRIRWLSDGVFRPWSDSPLRWILGGGASLALVDLWVRWWTYGL